ncbi:DUF3558 family protein [Rhodococcus spongiicola]|uniref:DUF3558 domain-containing protein n=1 Tax=Rhodococcus spongiicola TaxID=2487352 RepID=A0A3S3A5J5_9NOCA|nr:DUF3558 family protein [Rhodococcus spongiicola]RVW02556.1 DUF3558 domain-containing protein [Rhodococcus spongiicola]
MGRRGGAIVAAASVLALVGCGSGGEGQAETKAQSEEPVFDPCSVPEDVLLAIGVDPATEERDIMGVKQPGWSLCSWRETDRAFYFTIFATGRPLDAIRTNERAIDVTSIDLPGRGEAFTFRETSDTLNKHCDVLLTAGPDTLMLRTSLAKGLPPAESPCPQAIENAKLLEPSLPR